MKIFEDLPKDINIDIPKYLQYDGHKINSKPIKLPKLNKKSKIIPILNKNVYLN